MIGVIDPPRIAALKKAFAAYRAVPSEETARAYKDELADIPDDVLVKAVDAAIQGEAFMPTVARIRTYADRFRPEVPALPEGTLTAKHYLAGEVAPVEDNDPILWRYCSMCRDTGWVEEVRAVKPPYTMPVAVGQHDKIERRVIEVERKSYFSRCKCRPTNPKLIADRQRTAKYSREAEK